MREDRRTIKSIHKRVLCDICSKQDNDRAMGSSDRYRFVCSLAHKGREYTNWRSRG